VTNAPIIWIDGALVAADEARISPFDHGLLVGDGVFETLRVYAGVPFAWRRHAERLEHSASGLGLRAPDRATLRDAADSVLSANGLREARLRITVTGGPAPLGSERGETRPTVIVAATEAREWPASERIVTVPWPRNERGATAGLKTISYADNVRALAYAHDRDASEALFLNTVGDVCEATGSNIFFVVDEGVVTPPGESGCLLGVTRALILELCPELGIEASTRRIAPRALEDADEAFLTSSTREVQAVSHIDDTALPVAPGPVTQRLAQAFRALVAHDPDP
jgi:branched-chain amino acid aminotransferase